MSAEQFRMIAQTNEAISAKHTPWPLFTDLPNMKATMILTCMDPRANPKDFWKTPDIPIIRNVGGRATEDVLRSIRFLSGVMSDGRNTVGVVAVIHHTDCGLECYADAEVRKWVKEHSALQGKIAEEMDDMKFGSWKGTSSLEDSVKLDMEIIKNDPYLPKDLQVIGYTYDVFSGVTKEVGQI